MLTLSLSLLTDAVEKELVIRGHGMILCCCLIRLVAEAGHDGSTAGDQRKDPTATTAR